MYRAARLSGTRDDGALRAAIRDSVSSGSPAYAEYASLETADEDEARRLVHEYLLARMVGDLRMRAAKEDTFVYRMHAIVSFVFQCFS